MIILFAAVDEKQIRDFENGIIDKEKMVGQITEADRIELNQIDRVFNVLTEEDEYSPYWNALGGEILAGGNGEALPMEYISFEDEDGSGFEICDPTVYMTDDEVKEVCGLLKEIDEEEFKKRYDSKTKRLTKLSFLSQRKRELKQNAEEICGLFWNELDTLKKFYEKKAAEEKYIIISGFYEEEDFNE